MAHAPEGRAAHGPLGGRPVSRQPAYRRLEDATGPAANALIVLLALPGATAAPGIMPEGDEPPSCGRPFGFYFPS